HGTKGVACMRLIEQTGLVLEDVCPDIERGNMGKCGVACCLVVEPTFHDDIKAGRLTGIGCLRLRYIAPDVSAHARHMRDEFGVPRLVVVDELVPREPRIAAKQPDGLVHAFPPACPAPTRPAALPRPALQPHGIRAPSGAANTAIANCLTSIYL